MEALVIGDICPREENALLERSPDRPARVPPGGHPQAEVEQTLAASLTRTVRSSLLLGRPS